MIGTRFFNSETSESINNECSWTPPPSCGALKKDKFRTIDGSCNNLANPNYGRAATPFQRVLGLFFNPLREAIHKVDTRRHKVDKSG